MSFSITDFAKLKFYEDIRTDEILDFMKNKMQSTTTRILSQFAEAYRKIIFSDIGMYISADTYKQTKSLLENLFLKSSSMDFDDSFFNSFFIGYHAYCQARDISADLSGFNVNVEIKNRMFRLPTYNSLVEGCLTNLYKTILWVLDIATGKDFSTQTKLKPICDALASNGFVFAVRNVDIDIRNAINHGGVVFKRSTGIGDEIDFHFSKNNTSCVKTLKVYELDKLLETIFDDAGGVLLGLCDFINNHFNDTCVSISIKSYSDFCISAFEMSNNKIICRRISENGDATQLNADFYVSNPSREAIHQISYTLSLMLYSKFPNYEKYFLGFSSLRMMNGWVRFTKQEISDMGQKSVLVEDVFHQAIKRRDIIIFEPSTEEVDIQEIKYFKYPSYKTKMFSINNIADASTPERKRLRASLFIGDISDKRKIVTIINDAIKWLETVKNPAERTMVIKHGDMSADSLYINVYRSDSRRNKELFPNNENFVCFVDYNVDAITSLKNGGLPAVIWSKLYHEEIGCVK